MTDQPYLVYVIAKSDSTGLTSPVKVGISADPDKRVGTLQTACPFKIDLAYVFECPNREIAKSLERSFHKTQKSHRAFGEWFNHHPLDAIHILCLGYRTMLLFTCPDKEIHQDLLQQSGVLWAEKRFELKVPKQREIH